MTFLDLELSKLVIETCHRTLKRPLLAFFFLMYVIVLFLVCMVVRFDLDCHNSEASLVFGNSANFCGLLVFFDI